MANKILIVAALLVAVRRFASQSYAEPEGRIPTAPHATQRL